MSKEFFASTRAYYIAACMYITEKFPLSDELLKHAEVVGISNRGTACFESVLYFVDRFQFNWEKDKLQQQFLRYQIAELGSNESIDVRWSNLRSG